MSARLAAAGGLALAALLQLAVTRPVRQELEESLQESRALRDQTRGARARLAELERGEALRARAFSPGSGAEGGGLAALRRSVLAAVERAGVGGVRLEVRPGAPPLAATVKLFAEGRSAEVLSLVERLAGPGTNVVLQQVRLAPTAAGLSLELDAARLGETP